MTTARLLAFFAAAALGMAAPALAQHADLHAQKEAAAIAEGTVQGGVRTTRCR